MSRSEDLRDITEAGWDECPADSIRVIGWAPCWMAMSERLLLYSLVFALRPRRYLEIGTFKGGSALIVAAAMEASRNPGRMVCIDPDPHVEAGHWEQIKHRADLVIGASPGVLGDAERTGGGPFDFVLVDGDHSRAGVARDVRAVVEKLASGGYLVCHDGYNPDVSDALDEFAAIQGDRVVDMGMLTRDISYTEDGEGRSGPWGGLRLFRKQSS